MTARKLINFFVAASLIAGTALPSFAQTAVPTPAMAPAATSKKTLNVACIQSAIETRDNAIISAVSAHTSAQTAALVARKTALKSAWAMTDQKSRRSALRDAWKAFSGTSQTARKAFRAAQHTAWQQFNASRKACGTRGASDDPGNEGHDSQL